MPQQQQQQLLQMQQQQALSSYDHSHYQQQQQQIDYSNNYVVEATSVEASAGSDDPGNGARSAAETVHDNDICRNNIDTNNNVISKADDDVDVSASTTTMT